VEVAEQPLASVTVRVYVVFAVAEEVGFAIVASSKEPALSQAYVYEPPPPEADGAPPIAIERPEHIV